MDLMGAFVGVELNEERSGIIDSTGGSMGADSEYSFWHPENRNADIAKAVAAMHYHVPFAVRVRCGDWLPVTDYLWESPPSGSVAVQILAALWDK